MFLSNSYARSADLPVFWDTSSQCVAEKLLAHISKTMCCRYIPAVPCKFRQEARQSIPHSQKITGRLGTCDNPELLAVSGSWKSLESFGGFLSCSSFYAANLFQFLHFLKGSNTSSFSLHQVCMEPDFFPPGMITWLIRLIEFHALRMNLQA